MAKNKETNKGKITGIIPGIILIVFLIGFFTLINSTTENTTSSVPISKVLEVNDFYKTAVQTISIDELIAKYGEPENKETWNYKKNSSSSIPITTLYYDNSTYEYSFHDNMLVRITINKDIQYNSTNDIFAMFGLSKHDSTKINNTNSSIRIYNTSVPDFWCQTTNKTMTCTKITFIDGIFD